MGVSGTTPALAEAEKPDLGRDLDNLVETLGGEFQFHAASISKLEPRRPVVVSFRGADYAVTGSDR